MKGISESFATHITQELLRVYAFDFKLLIELFHLFIALDIYLLVDAVAEWNFHFLNIISIKLRT
jgi:hypothetical protein